MSSSSRLCSLALALLLWVAGASCGARRPRSLPGGEIAISTDAAEALVYLEGRFVGYVFSESGPLRLQLPPGEWELRATSPGHVDLLSRVRLEANERVRMTAAFGALGEGGGEPPWSPLLGPGQVLRGRIGAGRSSKGDAVFTTLGVLDGEKGQRWTLAVNVSLFPLDVALVSDDDAQAPVSCKESGEQLGLRARQIFEFEIPKDGRYRVRVRSRPGVPENLFVLRLLLGPPPFIVNQGSGQPRRRPAPIR